MRIDEKLQSAAPDRPLGQLRASDGLLEWLMRWSHGTPQELRPAMNGALLSSPVAVILGGINGLFVAALALFMIGGTAFAIIMLIEAILMCARLASLKRVSAVRAKGEVPYIDIPVTLSLLWCALQGTLFFLTMRSGNTAIMVITAAHCMGLVGPLCARNYAAPRLAMLLVGLCVAPFLIGAVTTGDPLLLALLALLPGFLLGSTQLLSHYRGAMLCALSAELLLSLIHI